MVKMFRALIGVFTFRRLEIAQLELQQQMDAQGFEPLGEPTTETHRSGFIILKQSAVREDSIHAARKK